MTWNRWAIPAAAMVIAALTIGAGFALASTGGDSDGKNAVRQDAGDDRAECAAGGGENCDAVSDCAQPPCDDVGDGAAGICIEGTVDCVDTIDTRPTDDICIQIFPTPPECTDPDTPVTSDPGTIVDPQGSSGCSAANAIEECQKRMTELAIVDLAGHLQIGAESITFVSAEFVEWPNACLGIETADVACAEIITPGFQIILEANGESYQYHTDTGTRVLLAE